jgi:hypothetical protein
MGWKDTIRTEEQPAQSGWRSTVREAHGASGDWDAPEPISAGKSTLLGAAQGGTFGLADEGEGALKALKDVLTERPLREFGEAYTERRDAAREDYKKAEEANPKAYLAGDVAASVATSFVPGVGPLLNAGKGAKLASVVGKSAASGALSGFGRSEEEDLAGLAKDTTIGAAVGGVASTVLPAAGAAFKGAKSLLPGTSGALPVVNKATAQLASLVPSQDASADDIFQLLSNPELRRKAANTDVQEQAIALAPKLEQARTQLDDSVGAKFRELEQLSLQPVQGPLVQRDLATAKSVIDGVQDSLGFIQENSKLYGKRVNKLYNDVLEIMNNGGPKERQLPTYHKDLFSGQLSATQAAAASKARVLNSRRHVDDYMKNKNFEALSQYEKQAIGELRNNLDLALKQAFTGQRERQLADQLFSGKEEAAQNFFKPLTTRAPSGDHFVDPGKLGKFATTGEARGKLFEDRAAAVREFVENNQNLLGQQTDVSEVVKAVEDLREIGKQKGFQESMKRASGGPTSQAINAAAQLAAGYGTGGASVLGLPITNPYAYTKLVDGAAALSERLGDSAFVQSLGKFAGPLLDAAKRGPAAVALTHGLLLRDPDYRKKVGEQ